MDHLDTFFEQAGQQGLPSMRLLRFMCVSKRWYNTVISSPILWTRFLLCNQHTNHRVEKNLSRSGVLPLEIDIDMCITTMGDQTDSASNYLTRCSHRWRRLTISSSCRRLPHELILSDLPIPILEDVRLVNGNSIRCICQGQVFKTDAVRVTKLHALSIRTSDEILPSIRYGVTRLCISFEAEAYIELDPHYLLDLLETSPQLQALRLVN
jgi:hypothetical protein